MSTYSRPALWLAIAVSCVLIIVNLLPWISTALPASDIEFKLERGWTSREIGRALADRKIIRSEFLFVGYAKIFGYSEQFKAGTYDLSGRASLIDLYRIFSSGGESSDDVEVTIPEGTNLADIDRILAKAGLIEANELIKAAVASHSYQSYEGFLFPDTYRFFKDASPERILKTMRDNFDLKTEQLFKEFPELQSQHLAAFKGYILVASILEKEVQTDQDMRLVAGIIQNRLRLGMPLQIDATVAYGACLQKFTSGRYCDVSGVNLVDAIKRDTVYNTYTRTGLPVSPISNPGLASLRAALSPTSNEYLYYLSKPDGTTVFSRTLAEHNAARAKYLK